MISLIRFTIALVGCGFTAFAQDAAPVQMKVVKGVPFTAKAVTESTQTLVDGNHIVRKSEAAIARDSEGRTRRDRLG